MWVSGRYNALFPISAIFKSQRYKQSFRRNLTKPAFTNDLLKKIKNLKPILYQKLLCC